MTSRQQPIPSTWHAFWAAATLHQRTYFRGSRRWSGPLLMVLPLLMSIAARFEGRSLLTFEQKIAPLTIFGGLALLLPLLYAGSCWSEDAERKTLPYLLLRPIQRRVLYVAKLSSTILYILMLLWLTELVCFFVVGGAYGEGNLALGVLFRHMVALFFAATTYGALFACIGMLFPKIALFVGIAYAGIMEVFVAQLPLEIANSSLQAHIVGLANQTGSFFSHLFTFALYFGTFIAIGCVLAERRDHESNEQ